MASSTYIQLINKVQAFCDAHLAIKRFDAEFGEQRPNLATDSEEYPYVFMEPTSVDGGYDVRNFSVTLTCYDIIQKDRANINTIVSDCEANLQDLYAYFNQGLDSDVIALSQSKTPLNNFDSDYVAGWSMTIVFELEGWCTNAIPMNPITPSTDGDVTVENSDATYSTSVDCGDTLVLPDITVTDSDGSTASYPSVKDYVCTPQVKSLFLKGIFASGSDTMETITIDADNAGTYTSITDDGSSGSITLDINGGGFGAFSNPTVLAVSDVLIVKRTITTASGWYKLTGTYV